LTRISYASRRHLACPGPPCAARRGRGVVNAKWRGGPAGPVSVSYPTPRLPAPRARCGRGCAQLSQTGLCISSWPTAAAALNISRRRQSNRFRRTPDRPPGRPPAARTRGPLKYNGGRTVGRFARSCWWGGRTGPAPAAGGRCSGAAVGCRHPFQVVVREGDSTASSPRMTASRRQERPHLADHLLVGGHIGAWSGRPWGAGRARGEHDLASCPPWPRPRPGRPGRGGLQVAELEGTGRRGSLLTTPQASATPKRKRPPGASRAGP